MTDVFISYKREDLAVAKAVSEGLRGRGYQVWYDAQNIATTADFYNLINTVIDSCKVGVTLWSQEAIGSDAVRGESLRLFSYPGEMGGKYIGVRIEPDLDLPAPFNARQCIEMTSGPSQDVLEDLIRAVEHKIGPPAPEARMAAAMDLKDKEAVATAYYAQIEANPTEKNCAFYLQRWPGGRHAELVRKQLEEVRTLRWRAGKFLTQAWAFGGVMGVAFGAIFTVWELFFQPEPSGSLEEIAAKDAQIAEIREQAQTERSGLQTALAAAETERTALEDRLRAAQETLEVAAPDVMQLTREADAAARQVVRLTTERDRLRSDLAAAQEAGSTQQARLLEIEQALQRAERDTAQSTERLRTAEADAARFDRQAKAAQTQLATLTQTLASAQADLAAQGVEIAALTAARDQTTANLDVARRAVAQLETALEAAQTAASEQAEEIEQLKRRIAELEGQAASVEIEAELAQARTRITELEATLNKAISERAPTLRGDRTPPVPPEPPHNRVMAGDVLLIHQSTGVRAEDLEPGEIFKECDACPEMVVIAGGSFLMGSPEGESGRNNDEGPQHRVTLRKFAMARYETTFAEWDACAAGDGCQSNRRPSNAGWGRGRRPVINVSWNDIQRYEAWINEQAGASGSPYRLPSESEWEYAARAGSQTPFEPTVAHSHGGRTITPDEANFDGDYTYNGSEKGEDRRRTVAVDYDGFRANAWGLWQMHGNVWEWCEDDWVSDYSKDRTQAPHILSNNRANPRVLRGGSWFNNPQILRAANRNRNEPGNRDWNYGFRLTRTL